MPIAKLKSKWNLLSSHLKGLSGRLGLGGGVKSNQAIISTTQLPDYTPPPPTNESLDWADLPIIDFSKYPTDSDDKSSRDAKMKDLSNQILDAMRTCGFFYIVNHGWVGDKRKKIFSIANATFDLVNEDEKREFMGKETDVYVGYKPRQTWTIENGITDQIEHYNINKNSSPSPEKSPKDQTQSQAENDTSKHVQRHPKIIEDTPGVLDEIREFEKFCHEKIVYGILRLMAIGLEIDEETFVKEHLFEDEGQSSVRFMKYYPRTDVEEEKTKNVWLKGHTDIGSITLLLSQPISGLQILSPDGKWRYIRYIDDALVVNSGDVLQLLSGGYYKPTIHRVIKPPKDQLNKERLGVFYFAMASDKTKLEPHWESPVLKREGIVPPNSEDASSEENVTKPTPTTTSLTAPTPTMKEWRKERTEKYGRTTLVKSQVEKDVEEDVVCGIVVKEYN